MKNLLIATTALVMTAGVAAADVAVKGDARMGLKYTEGAAQETVFSSRVRVNFTLSAKGDNGLTFGASIRADNASAGSSGTGGNAFVSGAFGKLSMGDVDSAGEAATANLHNIGYSEIAQRRQMLGNTTDPSVLYEFKSGALTFYAGMDQLKAVNQNWSLGVKYVTGDYTFGLGYEDIGTATHTIGTVSAKLGTATVNALYGSSGSAEQYGVSVSAPMGGVTLIGYYMNRFAGTEHYGVGMQYGLGGGASLRGGIQNNNGDTEADLGIVMAF
jgi:outer membrane protein OmpU